MTAGSTMNVDTGEHEAAVAAWFQRAARGRSVTSLVRVFEDTFARMWQRALVTLGEVTLTAIVERVLHTAREQFPFLASVDVVPTGVHWSLGAQEINPAQAAAASRFFLVEFLTVLGTLTDQILTSALHAELATGRTSPGLDHAELEIGTRGPS
jgi:hypothetical protein